MASIQDIQDDIIEEFDMFEEWMEKYEHIIELGKTLPLIDAQYKTEEHIIKGCQSQVWLHADFQNGNVIYTADSDAIMTKNYRLISAYIFQSTAQQHCKC